MAKRGPYKKSIEIESTNYCCYGCGNKVKFLSPRGKEMCDTSANKCPVNKKKNSAALADAYKSGEFTGTKGLPSWKKGMTAEDHDSIKKSGETYSKRYSEGLYDPWDRSHSIETRQLLSDIMSEKM